MFGRNKQTSDGEETVNINKLVGETTNKLIHDFSGSSFGVSRTKVADNVLAFIGGAGGTGTSTVMANLAYMIAKKDLTVLVIDLNIMYPIQHCYFGIKQEIERKDLVTFLMGKNQIGESIITKDNFSIMYPNNRYMMDYINCDNKQASQTLSDAINNVRHLFDVILIDVPRTLEFDAVNCVLYSCDTIYSVWDENIACISGIDRFRKNLQLSGIEAGNKLKVIFNKKTDIYYTKSVFESLKLDVMATLPFDTAIIESGLKGEIFCEKGASISKNAAAFVSGMQGLTDAVLKRGGYTNG